MLLLNVLLVLNLESSFPALSLISFSGFFVVSSDDEIDYSVEPEFYDPNLDDVDELWVNKQRKSKKSDAVLSCPACFTTLCLDCQR
jgi:E2F-associated phosphoprotein